VNPRSIVAAVALVALPLAACGQSCRRQGAALLGFEGEIELHLGMSPAGAMGPLVFSIKGDRLRVEMKGAPISFVYVIDSSKHVSYLIDDAAKKYTRIALTDPSAADASAAVSASPPRKTGTGVVAGHPCTVYESSMSSGLTTMRSEWCMAEDLGSPMLGPLGKLVGGGTPFTMFGGSGFPLRMRTYDGAGALLYSMEATRVERRSEPDSLFEPPPGYASTDAGI
jgi:hypothetical protein